MKQLRTKRWHVLTVSLAVFLSGGLLGWLAWQNKKRGIPRAQLLYEKNCAICHGLTGDGKGEASYLLQPKPRNFRAGKFRLVSSLGLQPTRDDLFRTLSYGMPGTAMPSWAHLPEEDRRALADFVLKLNRDGWYEKGLKQGYSKAEAAKYADEMTSPGTPVAVPAEPALTKRGLEEGRKYFVKACATCHMEDGKGKRDRTWRTAEGFPTWSRNFREGVFKGGREGKQLFLRFFTGLPGTPMPSGQLSPEEVWRVVQYVQSLSDPRAQEQAEIHTQELVARREKTIPADPADPLWDSATEKRIPLMPLWWREGHVNGVRVKAVHDGQRFAFRLEWNDPTPDFDAVRQKSFPDGAAVQLTASADPPLFAMGSAQQAVNIWHWKALWSDDEKEFQDVAKAFPGMAADAYFGQEKGWRSRPSDDVTFLTAEAAHNPLASHKRPSLVENANAGGLGSYTTQAAMKQSVRGLAHWKEGRWTLQLIRDLRADREDVALLPGTRLSVAFAIWDGHGGDRNGQKNVSIWNALTVEK